MRVAFDATPLLGNRTGVATLTGGLLRALVGVPNVEPVAYALSARGAWRLHDVVPPGVAACRRPLPATLLTRAWQKWDRPRVETLVGSVDVVHGTNFVVPPTKRAGAVVTVHDLAALRFPDLVEPASRRYPPAVSRAVRDGALVHVTTRAVADDVVELLGVEPDRVRVVASGVDAPRGGDPEAGRRLAGAERFVLALGTVEPRKALPDLVRAFDLVAERDGLRDVALVLAGPDGWGTDALLAAVDSSPARRRIRRLGRVDDADRADLLAGATLLAMPSRDEGFGYPPLEAMAAGLPVVATTAGALRESIGDAGVLVAPGDVDALAEAIAEVLTSDDARERLVEAGRERVARFSWESFARGMAVVYRDALEAR
ncbi:MAG TPA: glycosyltransferase family 1 protein [Acidimicrobiales bacterium]|nr:glycosyltransferase family 1 protein [Acidimicrobiales bacterium]